MNNHTFNENELINQLVELALECDYVKEKEKEYLQCYAETYHIDIMRQKWRENHAKYRENHREKYNKYSRGKGNQYYHANKEEINKKRAIKYQEKKEEKRLKDLAEKNLTIFKESLGETQKIDS